MQWVIGYWQISIQRVFPTKEQLTQSYNTVAPSWHRLVQRFGYDHAYAKLFQSLQQEGILAHLQDDSTVCDCGIGTAAFSLALAETLAFKPKIVGIDISPAMLNTAHQLLLQADVNHQVYQSNVNTLPFNDNTFDLVMAAHMLEHLPNPTLGLREMVRVLCPGAPLLLAVTHPGLLGTWIQWHWGNRCFASHELIKIMTDVGLTSINFYRFTVGLARWTSIACLGFKK